MGGPGEQKSDERRDQLRRLVCTTVEIASDKAGDAHQHSAIIHDLSKSGAFFLTRVLLEVGEPLKMVIHFSRKPDDKAYEATGKVVRAEIFEPDRADVWPCGVAVEFDEPLQGMDEELAELAERLVRVGLAPAGEE